MGATAKPFLMFQGNAEEAMNFYMSLFPGSEIINIARYGAEGPGPEGSVIKATFSVAGQQFLCTDSFVKHEFGFTPAFSIFVTFDSEEQLERVYEAFSEGGAVLMPMGDYGFSRKFGWVNDRYGVSWQLNLG